MKVPDDGSTTVTLYILVSRRGSRDQQFTAAGNNIFPSGPPVDVRTPAAEVTDCRGTELYSPAVWSSPYSQGNLGSTIQFEWPKIGAQGIGLNSGTVFRQQLNGDNTSANYLREAAPSPLLSKVGGAGGNYEPIVTVIPPTGWPDSPLIYIYQTQLSF